MVEKKFNIVDLFFDTAGKYPEDVAIIYKKQKITFSELKNQVDETSDYFSKKRIQKGDRVLVFVPMSIDLYRIVLALFKIGATAVFLDEWVSKKRMEECCKIAQCKAFIGVTKARILSFFSPEIRKIPIHLGTAFTVGSKNSLNTIPVPHDQVALITFTTGSTGVPKAAKRTHGFLLEQFRVLVQILNPKPGETSLTTLPVVLLINLAAGSSSLISEFKAVHRGRKKTIKILKQIHLYKVNSIVASPFFIKQLAKWAIVQQDKFPALKKIFTGGAPVFPQEAKVYLKAFPKTEIVVIYGSTEAEPISSINAQELIKENNMAQGLNAGNPDKHAEVKIIKLQNEMISCDDEDAFQKIILPEGSIGEIIVSGPHVLDAYFNNDEALKLNKIFVGNKCWHRTGDSGFLMDNTLFLTGRCNTLIHIHDKIISPFIYENYFQTIRGIEAGTLLEKQGQIIGVIECLPGFNKTEIIRQLQQIKEPLVPVDKIKWISKTPRDPRHHSKIDYEKLMRSLQ